MAANSKIPSFSQQDLESRSGLNDANIYKISRDMEIEMTFRIAGLAGSLSSPSKTRALVDLVAYRATERFAAEASSYDLGDLQPSLGQAQSPGDLDPLAQSILETILNADVLVVGSPVYKGSYSGLFKHLIDLIDPLALRDKRVLLTATGGGDRHALVIEHQLRPLFGFFEAATLPTGVYASAADFRNGVPASPTLLERIDRALDPLAGLAIQASTRPGKRAA